MNRWLIKYQKRHIFLIIGLVYSGLTPIGWLGLQHHFTLLGPHLGLFVYLFLSTAMILGLYSYLLGYTQDLLYEILERDTLTDLYNQQAFFRRAREHYQVGVRYRDEVAMLMLDIDHFKDVNDQTSHLVGSQVLKQLASLIVQELRRTDLAARFGGDEFIIFLPRTSLERARLVAERLRERIAKACFIYKDNQVRITASFGVAVVHCRPQFSLDELAEHADQQLYLAKDQGRNRVCVAKIEPDLASSA